MTMKLFSLFVPVALFAVVGAVGCAAPTTDGGDDDVSGGSQAFGVGVDVPNPSGTYFAHITANGTGCPAGSWEAGISDDGHAFTVTFSSYEAIVNPGQAFSIKDCTLSIDINTPSGFSFAVNSFYYQGYATLDSEGMSAKQTAKYYFRGNPVPGREFTNDMVGPFDDSYLQSNQVETANLVWSPCGATRTLNALTRLVLKNNSAKTGSGYLNASSVDGEVDAQWVFGLTWHKC
jgi:hypothetical protein